ncbi:MAG: NAD(P)(+) transhydrogenase (Re/Si-specific) subunit beta, partial [Chloroflexi bacterium]
MASVIIGSVTLTGSFIAFGKLQGFIPSRPLLIPIRNVINVALLIGLVASTVWLVTDPSLTPFLIAAGIALALGILVVLPIGGADMPVVIALLNSYSGIAGAATGFVLGNTILIIAGSLVGASGLILTRIMTKAMNRSLVNVMLGGFGVEDSTGVGGGGDDDRPVRSIQAEDAATILGYAQSVIFVPGYGLAVAQAQHQVRELADLLKDRGISVRYAIHPVAGRMPGHMNVLLAEANVPYDELKDLDQINSEFQRTDVAVVIGANDVTNPAARTDKSSPIYGMPILNVDQAASVIVMKRSMSTGFAGVQNELFFLDRTMMLFGDAKDSVEKILAEVKDLEGGLELRQRWQVHGDPVDCRHCQESAAVLPIEVVYRMQGSKWHQRASLCHCGESDDVAILDNAVRTSSSSARAVLAGSVRHPDSNTDCHSPP